MKICWDNLEKYCLHLTNKGNFRIWSGSQWKTVYYHDACQSCGDPYISGKNQKFCCQSCSNKETALNDLDKVYLNLTVKGRKTKAERYGNPGYTNREKAKQTNLERYGAEELFKSEKIKNQIKKTKKERYNDEKFINIEKRKETCLEKYGVEFPLTLPEIQNKRKKTCQEKWGVDNPYQAEEIKEKIKQTNLERYGAENVFEIKEFRNDKQKAKTFSITWKNKSEEELEQIANKKRETWKNKSEEEIKAITDKIYATQKKNGTFNVSKSSQIFFWKLYNLLDDELKRHCHFYELNDEYKVLNYFVDFIIGDTIIEFYGDKWHANPEDYDKFDKPRPRDDYKLTAEEIWNKDKKRIDKIKEENYKVLIIWHNEIIKDENRMLNKCLNFINNYRTR